MKEYTLEKNVAIKLVRKIPWPSAYIGFKLWACVFYTLKNDKIKNCVMWLSLGSHRILELWWTLKPWCILLLGYSMLLTTSSVNFDFLFFLAFTVKPDIIYKETLKTTFVTTDDFPDSEVPLQNEIWCLDNGEVVVILLMIYKENVWNPQGPLRKLMRLQFKDLKIQCMKLQKICFTQSQGSIERISWTEN